MRRTMVSGAKRAWGRHFGTAATGRPTQLIRDEAGSVLASSPTPSDVFQWPPPDEILNSRVFEFTGGSLEPAQYSHVNEKPPGSEMPAAVDAQEMSASPRQSPARPRQPACEWVDWFPSVRSR